MSRGGRLRQWKAGLRTAIAGVIVGALAWGAWYVAAALRENSRAMPAMAKAVAIRPPELITSRGGVLDDAWLARILALPANVSLMQLDLDKLRDRVLSDGQVLTATLTRHFPDRLVVKVGERTPAARIKVEFGGEPRELLVAHDGVVFSGYGFDRQLLETLPWVAGISLARDGAWFRPIREMHVVADLLARVQNEAPHLYEVWHIVAVDRLAIDHEVEVILKNGTTAVFSTRGSFVTQLARLDAILERLSHSPAARARIDLSLGREVPVMIEPLNGTGGKAASANTRVSAPILPLLSTSTSSSKSKREL